MLNLKVVLHLLQLDLNMITREQEKARDYKKSEVTQKHSWDHVPLTDKMYT